MVVDAAAASLQGAAVGLLQELYRGEDRETDGERTSAGDREPGPLWAAPDQ